MASRRQFRPRTFIGDMSASRLKSPIADSLPPAPYQTFRHALFKVRSWRIPALEIFTHLSYVQLVTRISPFTGSGQRSYLNQIL